MSGYDFMIDSSAVFWSSKKLSIILLFIMEAKYTAVMHAMKETLYLRTFITKIM